MAKVITRKADGVRILTLTWQPGKFDRQEELLQSHQGWGEATELVMWSLLKAQESEKIINELNQRIDNFIEKIEDGTLRFHERLIHNLEKGGVNGDNSENKD